MNAFKKALRNAKLRKLRRRFFFRHHLKFTTIGAILTCLTVLAGLAVLAVTFQPFQHWLQAIEFLISITLVCTFVCLYLGLSCSRSIFAIQRHHADALGSHKISEDAIDFVKAARHVTAISGRLPGLPAITALAIYNDVACAVLDEQATQLRSFAPAAEANRNVVDIPLDMLFTSLQLMIVDQHSDIDILFTRRLSNLFDLNGCRDFVRTATGILRTRGIGMQLFMGSLAQEAPEFVETLNKLPSNVSFIEIPGPKWEEIQKTVFMPAGIAVLAGNADDQSAEMEDIAPPHCLWLAQIHGQRASITFAPINPTFDERLRDVREHCRDISPKVIE